MDTNVLYFTCKLNCVHMEILMYCKLCVRARTVFLDPREWLSAGVDVAEFNESLLALLLELFPALNSLVEHLPQQLQEVVKALANRSYEENRVYTPEGSGKRTLPTSLNLSSNWAVRMSSVSARSGS